MIVAMKICMLRTLSSGLHGYICLAQTVCRYTDNISIVVRVAESGGFVDTSEVAGGHPGKAHPSECAMRCTIKILCARDVWTTALGTLLWMVSLRASAKEYGWGVGEKVPGGGGGGGGRGGAYRILPILVVCYPYNTLFYLGP